MSPCVLRKQCWARKCPRTAGGSSTERRFGCGSTGRPPESPRGQVQPHPRLNCSLFIPLTSSHLWALFLPLPQPFVCTTGVVSDVGLTEVWSTSSSALFWYLFLENCFVLFLLFYFDGSTLCICIHAVQSLPFAPAVVPLTLREKGSHLFLPDYKPPLPSPTGIAAALPEGDGVQKTSKSRASPPVSQARLFRTVSIEIVMGFLKKKKKDLSISWFV